MSNNISFLPRKRNSHAGEGRRETTLFAKNWKRKMIWINRFGRREKKEELFFKPNRKTIEMDLVNVENKVLAINATLENTIKLIYLTNKKVEGSLGLQS